MNLNDINARWAGCYAEIQQKGTNYIQAVHINEVYANDVNAWTMRVQFENNKTEDLPYNEYEILPRPKDKVFDGKTTVCVYAPHPARQWKRGVSDRNVSVQEFHRLVGIPNGCTIAKIDRPFNKVFQREYPNRIVDTCKAIHGAILARCINSRYWLSLSAVDTHEYDLWRMDILIGRVRGKTIQIVSQIHKQEVYDLVQRTGEDYYVSE